MFMRCITIIIIIKKFSTFVLAYFFLQKQFQHKPFDQNVFKITINVKLTVSDSFDFSIVYKHYFLPLV